MFQKFILVDDGRKILAEAKGHPSQVIDRFRRACEDILSPNGPWRITNVHGWFDENSPRETDMRWVLSAELK